MNFFEIAKIAQLNSGERGAYEDSLKVYRDLKNTIDTAMEEGWEEGLEKGREEGLEKGREEGVLRVAKNMLSLGMSIEAVTDATGLSVDELN